MGEEQCSSKDEADFIYLGKALIAPNMFDKPKLQTFAIYDYTSRARPFICGLRNFNKAIKNNLSSFCEMQHIK